ncbi:MAG: PEP-CTERM sorting domain-containing protein [Fimbriimonadaceae bacterium]
MMKSNRLLLASLSVCLVAGGAQATTWNFHWNAGDTAQNSDGGKVEYINASFDDVTNRFVYDVLFKKSTANGKQTDGYWLVMNDGPNPKGISNELAIFYFDDSKASGPILTAYGYNGINGDNSYKDGSNASGIQAPDRIASSLTTPNFVNGIHSVDQGNNSVLFSFDIDASVIKNHNPAYGSPADWFGTGFDDKVGLWFHGVNGVQSSYTQSGYLSSFSYGKQGWVDATNLDAVPEPGTMAVLAGLGALAARRRRKSSR